jgi:hypothetical protein
MLRQFLCFLGPAYQKSATSKGEIESERNGEIPVKTGTTNGENALSKHMSNKFTASQCRLAQPNTTGQVPLLSDWRQTKKAASKYSRPFDFTSLNLVQQLP